MKLLTAATILSSLLLAPVAMAQTTTSPSTTPSAVPTTKAACDKATNMKWDATANSGKGACVSSKM